MSCGHHTNWWQQAPWALLRGLPGAQASLPLPNKGPLPLPPSPATAVMASARADSKGDMALITAWLGVRGGHFISSSLGFLSCKMGEELEICSLCSLEGVGVKVKSCRKQISVDLLETMSSSMQAGPVLPAPASLSHRS